MSGQGPRGQDRDDWFGEPDVTRSRRPGAAAAADDSGDDDWLAGGRASSSRYVRRAVRQFTGKQTAAAGAALALAVLLIGLAVAGVFSSGGSPRAGSATTVGSTTIASTATQPPATTAQPPATTLKPGDHGAEVRTLQRALVALGHPTGKIDGKYGPATQKAVKAFQAASGLAADGVLGPKTLAALAKALGKAG